MQTSFLHAMVQELLDAQTIASENEEEVVKDDEDQKKSKEMRKKKRVKFAREIQR